MNKTTPADPLDLLINNGQAAPPSNIELIEHFIKLRKNKKDVSWAESSGPLLNVTFDLLENFHERMFSSIDFLIMAGHLDLADAIANDFFEDVTACLIRAKRLTKIESGNSCYNFPTYILK